MTNSIQQKLEVFQNKCLRRILKINWQEKITNEEVRARAGIRPLIQDIKERRWRWIDHVSRMKADAIPRTALRWTPDGKRTRGRPKETWRRTVEREMRDMGMNWNSMTTQAADRGQWRALVKAICTDR